MSETACDGTAYRRIVSPRLRCGSPFNKREDDFNMVADPKLARPCSMISVAGINRRFRECLVQVPGDCRWPG